MIKDYLLKGHDNARTLAELEALTGKPGRIIRRQINEERRETIILNMQDGRGYFYRMQAKPTWCAVGLSRKKAD